VLSGNKLAQTQQILTRILSLPKPQPLGPNALLISGGVKFLLDGSGGARTAWMYDDWDKNFTGIDAGNRGYPTDDPEVYRQQARLLHNAGIHISIGDLYAANFGPKRSLRLMPFQP